MALSVKDCYILSKKSNKTDRVNYYINYIYLDSKGAFQYMHSYIDENSYNNIDSFGSINKDGSLSVPKCYNFKGHYENYKFKADELNRG